MKTAHHLALFVMNGISAKLIICDGVEAALAEKMGRMVEQKHTFRQLYESMSLGCMAYLVSLGQIVSSTQCELYLPLRYLVYVEWGCRWGKSAI